MLRPVGGGREWQADPSALRPATERERLSARVRAANERTRDRPPPPAAYGVGTVDMHFDRPPRPAPGCADCVELDRLRQNARAAFDHSAVTDANVLLRRHQRAEHQRPEPAPQGTQEPPPRRKRRHP